MTRAKDTLAIYANQGRARRTNRGRHKFLRELMCNPGYRKFWSTHRRRRCRTLLFAEEEQRIAFQQSNVATWLMMPPSASFAHRPERVGHRDLRKVSAALQARTGMEPAARRLGLAALWSGHARRVAYVLRCRNATSARSATTTCSNCSGLTWLAGIADRYQYDLYLRQGNGAVEAVLRGCPRSGCRPTVMETEHRFELQVGSTKLTGRVDRIDRTGPDTVAIVDYKTGKPKSQEDADESLQLSLYAMAAQGVVGKKR